MKYLMLFCILSTGCRSYTIPKSPVRVFTLDLRIFEVDGYVKNPWETIPVVTNPAIPVVSQPAMK